MFGGLELKGTDSKDSDAGSSSTAAPAPAVSGFGFLNATPSVVEPAPLPAMGIPAPAAMSSGFSFLNPEPAPEPAAPEPVAAPAVSSGFDFLMSTTSITPAPIPEMTPAPEPSPPAEATSAFSFLMATTATDTPTIPEPEPASEPAPAGSSGFDFLMSTTAITPSPAIEPDEQEDIPPPMDLASTTPSVSVSSLGSASAAGPSLMDMTSPPAASSALPAGAGISFGGAVKPRGVKKKTRAARIGTGAAAVTQAIPPKRPQPPAPIPEPEPVETKVSARDEALQAAKRAEEFMTKKTIESVKEDPPEIAAAPSTDSVLQAAEKAAKEAKVLSRQHQSQQKQKSGFMGTFFKGFGGSQPPPPIHRGSSSNSNSSVDRLANKQKDMKRAMAEREMQYQRQSQQSKPEEPTPTEGVDTDDYVEDDDYSDDYSNEEEEEGEEDVAVSTSVPSYSPEEPTSSDTTGGNNPISSHFAPAKPPTIVVKELKPSPKKTKTAVAIFEEYEALFAQSVHKAMEQVENVRSTQKMLLEERFVAMAKLNLSEQQIKQVEAQLQVAVEEEDYELADQLGQVAEAHKREKEEVSMMLNANVKALAHLDSQKHLVVQGVASCFSNLAVRLTELKAKESSKDHSNDSETFRQFEVIAKQLSVEKERLQQDAKHLERDEQLLAEERRDLELAISEQSGVLEQQKDAVKEKLEGVEAEIEELRRQLEEKQKVAAGLRTEMHGFEDSIDKVRVKFSRQLNRVDKKEFSLQENRKEFESEQKAYERQKEAHEMQVQSHSEAMLAHDNLMRQLESELKLTKEFAEMIPDKVGFLEESPKGDTSEDDDEGDLASMQADVVKCEAAASEAKIILKAANVTLVNLESELAVLAAKIPQLENIKKNAAASRDFKAASKASKQIKDATARMKECQEELVGEAANRKAAAEEEAARLDAELEKTRKIAEEREKVSAQAKMTSLAEKIKQLKAIQSKMCGDSTSSENSVRGVGALVLEGQIKSLKAEGESLGQKYGGWKQLIGEAEVVADAHDEESPEEGVSDPKPAVGDGLTSRERILKVRELLQRISDAEASLEAAAAREDFDEAAELHDVFQNLQSELETIDLTEEEMEIAMGDRELPPEQDKPVEEEPPSEEVEEDTLEQGESEEVDEPVVDDEGAVEEKKEEEATEEEDDNDDAVVEAEPKDEVSPEIVASSSYDEDQMLHDEEATVDA